MYDVYVLVYEEDTYAYEYICTSLMDEIHGQCCCCLLFSFSQLDATTHTHIKERTPFIIHLPAIRGRLYSIIFKNATENISNERRTMLLFLSMTLTAANRIEYHRLHNSPDNKCMSPHGTLLLSFFLLLLLRFEHFSCIFLFELSLHIILHFLCHFSDAHAYKNNNDRLVPLAS